MYVYLYVWNEETNEYNPIVLATVGEAERLRSHYRELGYDAEYIAW